MPKVIKTIIISFILLAILLVAAAVSLPLLIDTNTVRQKISKQVREATQQELSLQGELSVSVFPWLGVRTGSLSLSQPQALLDQLPEETPEYQHFILAEQAEIKIKLLPLLKREVVIDRILLHRPQITYIVAKDGSTSFDELTAKADEAALNNEAVLNNIEPSNTEPSNERTPDNNVSQPPTLDGIGILISGVSITDGNIIIHDFKTGDRQQIKNIHFKAKHLLRARPSPIEFSATAIFDSHPIEFGLNAEIAADLQKGLIKLNNINIETHAEHAGVQLTSKIDDITYKQDVQQLTVNQLQVAAQYHAYKPQLVIPSIHVDLAHYKTEYIPIQLTEKKIGLDIRGRLMLKDWDNILITRGHVIAQPFNPNQVITAFDIPYRFSDTTAFQKLSMKTEFSGSVNGVAFKNIDVVLDETQLKGDFSILNPKSPIYRFNIGVDQLDIDRYLPADDPQQAKSVGSATTEKTGFALVIPMDIFDGVEANGAFSIEAFKASGATLSKVKMNIVSDKARATVHSQAGLYSGKLEAQTTFNKNQSPQTLHIKSTMNDVNLEPLLNDMQISDQFSGQGLIKADVVVTGAANSQRHKGSIDLAVKNGALKNIDIKKILDETQREFDKLRGKSIESASETDDQTRFAEMTASIKLTDNVLTNDNLSVKAPAFRVTGKGTVDLIKDNLNYNVFVKAVNTNEGQGGEEFSDLNGALIPVHFYGALSEPQYKIDIKSLLALNTKKNLKKQQNKLKEKALKALKIDGEDSGDEKSLEQEIKKKIFDKLF